MRYLLSALLILGLQPVFAEESGSDLADSEAIDHEVIEHEVDEYGPDDNEPEMRHEPQKVYVETSNGSYRSTRDEEHCFYNQEHDHLHCYDSDIQPSHRSHVTISSDHRTYSSRHHHNHYDPISSGLAVGLAIGLPILLHNSNRDSHHYRRHSGRHYNRGRYGRHHRGRRW